MAGDEMELDDAPEGEVSEQQWTAMEQLLKTIYDAKTDSGQELASAFRKMVNRRQVPNYYQVIREPMALSQANHKIKNRTYATFSDFTRDLALICHNAQLFNRPEAPIFQDAEALRRLVEGELEAMASRDEISSEDAKLPFLGEIPPPSPQAEDDSGTEAVENEASAGADREEEEEGEDEGKADGEENDGQAIEDDEDDEDDDEADEEKSVATSTGATRRRRSRSARESAPRRPGRPPRVDTPLDGRTKAILRFIRRVQDEDGRALADSFEKLPDKLEYNDYYTFIQNPLALDVIRRKARRRKYPTLAAFMGDVNTMFDNAKLYNEDGSTVFEDAVQLQKETKEFAASQAKRPDSDFVLEDGRLPRPEGVDFNGERWKTGDWVLIKNPNEGEKPIVSQIHRTWETKDGANMVNACWFYRPEQTVHHAAKRFFPNEVFKTGQYRDHDVHEILDRCFVLFVTRYFRGRPRGFPADKQVFCCESRYNEELKRFNKIKTWSSCFPEEVRGTEFEMDNFPTPLKPEKLPSPIKDLLPATAKPEDDLPSPVWARDDAPPKVGAVHIRPRDPNESPPPSPPPPERPLSSTTGSHAAPTFSNTTHPQPNGLTPASQPPIPHYAPRTTPQSFAPQFPIARHTSPPKHTGAATDFRAYRPRSPPSYVPPPAAADVYRLSEADNAAVPAKVRELYRTDEMGRLLLFTTPPLFPRVPAGDGGAEVEELRHSEEYLRFVERRKRGRDEEGVEAVRERASQSRDAQGDRSVTNEDLMGLLGLLVVGGRANGSSAEANKRMRLEASRPRAQPAYLDDVDPL